jgi:hypothetical protein
VFAEIRAKRGIVPARSVLAVINAEIDRGWDPTAHGFSNPEIINDFIEFRTETAVHTRDGGRAGAKCAGDYVATPPRT